MLDYMWILLKVCLYRYFTLAVVYKSSLTFLPPLPKFISKYDIMYDKFTY